MDRQKERSLHTGWGRELGREEKERDKVEEEEEEEEGALVGYKQEKRIFAFFVS